MPIPPSRNYFEKRRKSRYQTFLFLSSFTWLLHFVPDILPGIIGSPHPKPRLLKVWWAFISGRGKKTFLICYVTSHDLARKGSYDLTGERPSPFITVLPNLLAIGLMSSREKSPYEFVGRRPLSKVTTYVNLDAWRSRRSGDITLLFSQVTSRYHIIKGTSDLVSSST